MKKFLALFVAVMMMASLTVSASASVYDPEEAVKEFNQANPNLYWDGTEVAVCTYGSDPEVSTLIFRSVRFSSAQKIISLTEQLEPMFALKSQRHDKAFTNLMKALTPEIVNPGNIVALKAAMTDEELDQAWATLRDAAIYFLPGYVSWLENFEFLMPYGSLGHSVTVSQPIGEIETTDVRTLPAPIAAPSDPTEVVDWDEPGVPDLP